MLNELNGNLNKMYHAYEPYTSYLYVFCQQLCKHLKLKKTDSNSHVKID